jgi:hypothetical protein
MHIADVNVDNVDDGSSNEDLKCVRYDGDVIGNISCCRFIKNML